MAQRCNWISAVYRTISRFTIERWSSKDVETMESHSVIAEAHQPSYGPWKPMPRVINTEKELGLGFHVKSAGMIQWQHWTPVKGMADDLQGNIDHQEWKIQISLGCWSAPGSSVFLSYFDAVPTQRSSLFFSRCGMAELLSHGWQPQENAMA